MVDHFKWSDIMKIKNTYMYIFLLSVLMGTVAFSEEENKTVKIKINDIRVEDNVYTPYYGVDTEQDHEQGAAARWIRVGVYFTTEGGWIDELEITQLAVKKAEGEHSGVQLSDTEYYVNIDPGDHYVYVYLHPSYVNRYDIEAFDLDSAAIIKIGTNEVARMESTKNVEAGWSKNTDHNMQNGDLLNDSTAVTQVGTNEAVREASIPNAETGWSQNMKKGELLNHAETPFWFLNYDFKEIIRKNDPCQ